jgi:predicted PurR-regulated permease PerM
MSAEGSMTKPKADPDRITENIQRRELSSGVEGAGQRFTLAAALIVLSVVLGILLVWQTSSSLLVIFAGILFASFLDACARALGPVIPIGRAWRLTLVILILTALIVLGAIWGVGKIPEQARLLTRVIDAQLDVLQQRLLSVGVELFGPDGGRDFSRWFPDHDKLFGHAQTAVGTASSILANTLVIVFIGLLFSFNPGAYRDGVVSLVKPSSRDRVRAVLDEMGGSCARGLLDNLSGSCS